MELSKIAATNRKARFEYHILETYEAGIALLGSEVKSIRAGRASIGDAFIEERDGGLVVQQMNITNYEKTSFFQPDPNRIRKLLLHKKEINRILGKVQNKGLTCVVLSVYFNKKNFCKLQIALVQGKKLHDKRQTIKERDWQRAKASLLKNQDK